MAKRACLSAIHGFGRERNQSGRLRRAESTIRSGPPADGRSRLQDGRIRVDVAMTRSDAGQSESPRTREQHPGDAGSVTVSEFMFLAIGLVLGVASGAALIEIIRARPPARREVRLTVAQDAIPRRRASTLADDAFVTVGPEPAAGVRQTGAARTDRRRPGNRNVERTFSRTARASRRRWRVPPTAPVGVRSGCRSRRVRIRCWAPSRPADAT